MIVLDTHIWLWWVHADPQLAPDHVAFLNDAAAREGLAVSAISCWEVAKLVSLGRVVLPLPIERWFAASLGYPGLTVIPLTPHIAIDSTRLPGTFHRDPADQLIVATARTLGAPVATADLKVLAYPHVTTLRLGRD